MFRLFVHFYFHFQFLHVNSLSRRAFVSKESVLRLDSASRRAFLPWVKTLTNPSKTHTSSPQHFASCGLRRDHVLFGYVVKAAAAAAAAASASPVRAPLLYPVFAAWTRLSLASTSKPHWGPLHAAAITPQRGQGLLGREQLEGLRIS